MRPASFYNVPRFIVNKVMLFYVVLCYGVVLWCVVLCVCCVDWCVVLCCAVLIEKDSFTSVRYVYIWRKSGITNIGDTKTRTHSKHKTYNERHTFG